MKACGLLLLGLGLSGGFVTGGWVQPDAAKPPPRVPHFDLLQDVIGKTRWRRSVEPKPVVAVTEDGPRNREAFLERMGRVEKGWSEQQVLEVVGEPKEKFDTSWYYGWQGPDGLHAGRREDYWLTIKDGRVTVIGRQSIKPEWQQREQTFVRRMSQVKEGWSEQQVRWFAGEPKEKEKGSWWYHWIESESFGGMYQDYRFEMTDGRVAKIEHYFGCELRRPIGEWPPR